MAPRPGCRCYGWTNFLVSRAPLLKSTPRDVLLNTYGGGAHWRRRGDRAVQRIRGRASACRRGTRCLDGYVVLRHRAFHSLRRGLCRCTMNDGGLHSRCRRQRRQGLRVRWNLGSGRSGRRCRERGSGDFKGDLHSLGKGRELRGFFRKDQPSQHPVHQDGSRKRPAHAHTRPTEAECLHMRRSSQQTPLHSDHFLARGGARHRRS